ncbi:MAG TPA: hypothetical protein VEL28_18650 [Candidatus Binatia bacterium]|nr:hypothetical protein [Candidatus Binatia bacterium]
MAILFEHASAIAASSTLICALAAGWIANIFCPKAPRLFTVLSLYALSWSVLLPYYFAEKPETELLPAFSGMLFLVVGKLLRDEASSQLTTTDHQCSVDDQNVREVGLLDRWALALLLSAVIPGVYHIPGLEPVLGDQRVGEAALGTTLSILGYISLGHGAWALASSHRWLVVCLLLVLAAYSVIELHFTAQYVTNGELRDTGMNPLHRVLFSAAKVCLTALFCSIVVVAVPLQCRTRPKWL